MITGFLDLLLDGMGFEFDGTEEKKGEKESKTLVAILFIIFHFLGGFLFFHKNDFILTDCE